MNQELLVNAGPFGQYIIRKSNSKKSLHICFDGIQSIIDLIFNKNNKGNIWVVHKAARQALLGDGEALLIEDFN